MEATTRETYFEWSIGSAELNDHTRELRVLRVKIHAERGPLEVLATLLRDAGEVLTKQDDALLEAKDATRRVPTARAALSGPSYLECLGRVQVLVCQSNQVIALLQKLMTMPAGNSVSQGLLRVDPFWDPLRNHSGFQRILNGLQFAVK
jgi:hypothetical protein